MRPCQRQQIIEVILHINVLSSSQDLIRALDIFQKMVTQAENDDSKDENINRA